MQQTDLPNWKQNKNKKLGGNVILNNLIHNKQFLKLYTKAIPLKITTSTRLVLEYHEKKIVVLQCVMRIQNINHANNSDCFDELFNISRGRQLIYSPVST